MEREYMMGQHVKFVNQFQQVQSALVQCWHGDITHYQPNTSEPGCNIVIISLDKQKEDSYGRQIEHETSVVHKSNQPADGNYWCWPDEE